MTDGQTTNRLSREDVRRAPKVLLHDHLDGGLRPADDHRPGRRLRPRAPGGRRRVAGPLVLRVGRLGLAGALPRDLRPHRRGDADGAGDHPGRPRVRGGPGRGRRGLRRGALRPRAARRERPDPRRGRRRGPARLRGGDGGRRRHDRGPAAADRDAARRPLDGDRRAGHRLARPGRGRLRHRRRRGGLPSHPAPRRVRVPPARELPLHHPRRRGLRAAVDLGGHPVVRRRPSRPRRPHHRRHHRPRRRVGRARPAGVVRPGQADPARDVPGLQHPDRRRAVGRRAPDRAADRGCASGSPSTPTTG